MTTLPRHVKDWPVQWRERFEERAGILEFEAKSPRDQAEIDAEFDVRKQAYQAEEELKRA